MTHKRKRDWQKRKGYRLGWALPKGERYESIEDARQDLQRMYVELSTLFEIEDVRISTTPELLRPSKKRTSTSIYSPSRHCIICAVDMLYQRKLIHELCHGLNKVWIGGHRRNMGASHGYEYTARYIFALGLYMFDGDFAKVEQVAIDQGCKWNVQLLQQLKAKHYQKVA